MAESKHKKILVLISLVYEPYWSGAEKMVKEIAERLAGKYEITIITSQLKDRLPETEEKNGYRILRVGRQVDFAGKLFFPLRAAWLARRLKPDIAHAVMESYAGAALVLLKYLYPPAKRILTLQSGDLDDRKKQKQFFLRLGWRAIHRAPHCLAAISGFLAARAERLGRPREQIKVIPNGVDLAKIKSLSEEKLPARVICVGRFSWEKGHKYLLDAWPAVIKKMPGAKLVLVGEGALYAEIFQRIRELGIQDSVILKGSLPHDEAIREIARSSVFVCPSLAEGLGIVFIEAQACGTPPIGTRVGGIPDVIRDGENGLLIAPKDSQALAAAIIGLLADQPLAERLRQNGLRSAEKFDWPNIIARYDELYRNMIAAVE